MAVLWDLDGTLMDSSKLWQQAEQGFLAEHGLPWDPAVSARLLGANLHVAADVIAESTGVRFGVDDLATGMMGRVVAALADGVPWIPHAHDLARDVSARGVAQALVTSSGRPIVDVVLHTFDGHFDAVITLDDVTRPKPDPEPYLRALDALGANGAAGLAIEDSPSGIAAAKAAGLRVLGVGRHARDTAADVWLADLAGLDSAALLGLARDG